jgi:MFS family permease
MSAAGCVHPDRASHDIGWAAARPPSLIISEFISDADTGAPIKVTEIIHNDMLAAKGAAVIDLLLVVGMLFAIFLSDRVGRIRLQVFGFFGCAVGLMLAAMASGLHGHLQTVLIFIAFMLFNFMTNLGPNAQTYIIAGEVFPTKIRARGAGFAASFAKIGAVSTAFLFPILLAEIGNEALLTVLVGTLLLGAFVTYAFKIATAGRNLEEVDAFARSTKNLPTDSTPRQTVIA